MSVSEYRNERITELGEFMGNVIVGIYEGIRNGAANNERHFALASGRDQGWLRSFGQISLGDEWICRGG